MIDLTIKIIKDYVDGLGKDIAKLKEENKRLSNPFGDVKTLIPVNKFWPVDSARLYNNRYLYKIEELFAVYGYDKSLELYQAWYDKEIKSYEYNKPLVEHNTNLLQKIVELFKTFGLTKEVKKYKSSRHIKYDMVRAEWYKEICAKIPTHFPSTKTELDKSLAEFKTKLDKLQKEKEQREEQEKQKNAAIAKKAILEREFAVIKVQYHIPPEYDVEQTLEHLFKKNKYLMLADAMLANSNDWSDGCDYVQSALSYFEEDDSDFDKNIILELTSLCEDFEDGRCFRDCKYNYNLIFAKASEVEPGIVTTYEKLQEIKNALG